MTFNFIYEPDYGRLMYAVLIDARASIPQIKNVDGFIIKAYVDNKILNVLSNTIVYKIESYDTGAIGGYFSIDVNEQNKTAVLADQKLRPAFEQYTNIISTQITNFIHNNEFKKDFLFNN